MKRIRIRSIVFSLFVLIAVLMTVSCGKETVAPADMVLLNGKIATVDKSFSIAEAVAVRGDRIVKVGTNNDIEPYIGPKTHRIELQGMLVVPGLIDTHAHMTDYGISLTRLDFRGTTSFRQIADMVAEKAKTAAPGEWIMGRTWDQNDWDVKELPTH